MQKRAFSPEDALAAGPLRREALQLAAVAVATALAALTSYHWLHLIAGVLDCIVALPAAIALVVALRTIGFRIQVLVYVVALPLLIAVAIWNFSS